MSRILSKPGLGREGFTLVELMVVVGIIGILATIALPQYSKYQARSRQSEAKIALAAAYTAETSYATEQATFTACLSQIGVAPQGGKFFYSVGVDQASANGKTCGAAGNAPCNIYSWITPTTGQTCVVGFALPTGAYTPATIPASGYYASINAGSLGTVLPADGDFTAVAASATNMNQATFRIAALGDVSTTTVGTPGTSTTWDTWTIDNFKSLLNTNNVL